MWFLMKSIVLETINIYLHVKSISLDYVSLDLQDIISPR